jgi:hypothetical protein
MMHGGAGGGDPLQDFVVADDGDLAIFCDAAPTLGGYGHSNSNPSFLFFSFHRIEFVA